MTAGKIIPAIATTTCAVTGLVCLEAYKLVAGKGEAGARNSFLNLAINMYAQSDPSPPKRTKSLEMDPIAGGPVRAQPEGFTRWDKLEVKGDLTPLQLEALLASEHKLQVQMITAGKSILYNPLLFKSHKEARGNKPLRELLEASQGGKPLDRPYFVVDASVYDDDSDVLIPPIVVHWQ